MYFLGFQGYKRHEQSVIQIVC